MNVQNVKIKYKQYYPEKYAKKVNPNTLNGNFRSIFVHLICVHPNIPYRNTPNITIENANCKN